MLGLGVNVHPNLIDGRISEIEELRDHILELKNELKSITDNDSEGEYYSRYIECIGEIQGAMDSMVRTMHGYINFMNYAKTNYMTMSAELAIAIDKL